MNVISRTFKVGPRSGAATVSHNLRFPEMTDEILRAPQVGMECPFIATHVVKAGAGMSGSIKNTKVYPTASMYASVHEHH